MLVLSQAVETSAGPDQKVDFQVEVISVRSLEIAPRRAVELRLQLLDQGFAAGSVEEAQAAVCADLSADLAVGEADLLFLDLCARLRRCRRLEQRAG